MRETPRLTVRSTESRRELGLREAAETGEKKSSSASQEIRSVRERFSKGVPRTQQKLAAKRLRELTRDHPKTWLVDSYADAVANKLSEGQVLERGYITDDSVLPFRFSKDRYAMLQHQSGAPALLLSDTRDRDAIGRLVSRERQLRTELAPIWSRKEQLRSQYSGDQHDWPLEVIKEYQDKSSLELEYETVCDELRKPFLLGDQAGTDSEARSGRRVDLRRVFERVSKRFPSGEEGAIFDSVQELFSEDVRSVITQDLRIPLDGLTLEEQMVFLAYALKVPASRGAELQSFVQEFGVAGLRTFLATAVDESMGEKVITFTKEAGTEPAKAVFAAFGTLADSIDSAEAYLKEVFGVDGDDAINSLVEKQLSRARNLLAKAHDFRNSPDDLLGLVKSVQADTQLFLDACKTLRQQGALSLEMVRDTSLEIVAGNTISEGDANAMRNIQEKYYADKYPESLMQELREGLDRAFASPDVRFYLYRKGEELVTFVRFDGLTASNDNGKHMGSFMTNPVYEGGALGQALLETALSREIISGPLYAECDPSLVTFYEKFDFRLLRSYKDDHGVDTCDIVLDPEPESLREAA